MHPLEDVAELFAVFDFERKFMPALRFVVEARAFVVEFPVAVGVADAEDLVCFGEVCGRRVEKNVMLVFFCCKDGAVLLELLFGCFVVGKVRFDFYFNHTPSFYCAYFKFVVMKRNLFM